MYHMSHSPIAWIIPEFLLETVFVPNMPLLFYVILILLYASVISSCVYSPMCSAVASVTNVHIIIIAALFVIISIRLDLYQQSVRMRTLPPHVRAHNHRTRTPSPHAHTTTAHTPTTARTHIYWPQ